MELLPLILEVVILQSAGCDGLVLLAYFDEAPTAQEDDVMGGKNG